MKKKTRKSLIEYGIIIVIFGGLYFTGLHTEVLGFLQRGVLATGLMDPDLEKDSQPVVRDNQPKADLSMNLINSKGERIGMEELRGQVIFLNLWATWCPPCIAEMPGINKLYREVDQKKVTFIMLSLDQDFQKAIEFKNRKGFDFEVYYPEGVLPQMYHSQSIPTTYVIDAQGNLVLTHKGMGDFNTKDFREFLEDQI